MLEAFALSDKGCVRSNNEDYCLIEPSSGSMSGGRHGRRQAGEHASRMAVETVAETVREAAAARFAGAAAAVEEANRRVLEAAQSDPSLEGMGTTLVAALELDGRPRHRQRGRQPRLPAGRRGLRAITDDQTWVNEVGRPLGLDEESLRHHPMRHVLTMAIGAGAPLTVNYYCVPLAGGALVLMCSDGLHGVVERRRWSRS